MTTYSRNEFGGGKTLEDVRIILKNIINERGFNQAAIARKAHMTPSKLSDILNQRRRLDANEMFNLCDAMEINYSELKPTRSA